MGERKGVREANHNRVSCRDQLATHVVSGKLADLLKGVAKIAVVVVLSSASACLAKPMPLQQNDRCATPTHTCRDMHN